MSGRPHAPRRRVASGPVAVVAVVALVGATVAGCGRDGLPDDVAARVDGHVVTVDELRAYASASSLDVADPAGLDRAMAGVVREKALELDARSRGLLDSVDFDAIVAGAQDANATNAAAIGSGQAVYGVSRFTVDTFYARAISTLRQRLLDALLADGTIAATDDELRALYERERDDVAKLPDDLTLDLLRFEPTADGAAAVEDVQARLAAGEAYDDVAAGYASGGDPSFVDRTKLEVDQDSAYLVAKYRPALDDAARALAVGDTRVVDDDLAGGFLVVHCDSRRTGGYRTFDDVRSDLVSRYADEQLQRYADGLVAGKDVVENDRIGELVH